MLSGGTQSDLFYLPVGYMKTDKERPLLRTAKIGLPIEFKWYDLEDPRTPQDALELFYTNYLDEPSFSYNHIGIQTDPIEENSKEDLSSANKGNSSLFGRIQSKPLLSSFESIKAKPNFKFPNIPAKIYSVDFDSNTAKVGYFDRNDIEDIEIDALMSINPQLLSKFMLRNLDTT